MNGKKSGKYGVVAVAALIGLIPMLAQADPWKHRGWDDDRERYHDRGEWYGRHHDRTIITYGYPPPYYVQPYVPEYQYRIVYPAPPRPHCRRGYVIPEYVRIHPVQYWDVPALPPPPRGAFYGYVDNDLLLISNATHAVLDALVAVNAASNGVD